MFNHVEHVDRVELLLIGEEIANLSKRNCFFGQDLQDLQDFMNAVFVGFKILVILLILSKRGFASTSVNNHPRVYPSRYS